MTNPDKGSLVEKVAHAIYLRANPAGFQDWQYVSPKSAWEAYAEAALSATPLVKLREALEEWRRINLLLKDGKTVGGSVIDAALAETDAALSSNLEGG